MAVVMEMHWTGIDEQQYEQARERVRWDTDVADGAKLHICAIDADSLHVTDVWESEEAFGRFADSRLMPAVQELGIEGQPDVRFRPLHALFAPALGLNEQVAAV